MRLAAIDIGTVTARLLVADVVDGVIHEVERSTDITHLGEGLSNTGVLSTAGMARASGVIERYVHRMGELGAERYVAMATSASRDAKNSEEFLAMLARHGIVPEVIAGSREADLAFMGATYQTTGDGLLVVDCGGGSTELILGDVDAENDEAHIRFARSIDIGSRRMTDRFLHSDPPTATELDRARAWAADELKAVFERLDGRPRRMIGLAGTATSIASIRLGMEVYDASVVHGYVVTGADLSETFEMLAELPLAHRREVVGLHPERAGVIVAGVLILEAVLALSGLDEMTVSEHDILYGMLLDRYRSLSVGDRLE